MLKIFYFRILNVNLPKYIYRWLPLDQHRKIWKKKKKKNNNNNNAPQINIFVLVFMLIKLFIAWFFKFWHFQQIKSLFLCVVWDFSCIIIWAFLSSISNNVDTIFVGGNISWFDVPSNLSQMPTQWQTKEHTRKWAYVVTNSLQVHRWVQFYMC